MTLRSLAIALLLVAGCSSSGPSGAKPASSSSTETGTATVLFVPWGGTVTTLGYDPGNESEPDGPRGFVVDTSHYVHVLDSLNGRIAVYSSGKLGRYVGLPSEDFTDLDVDPSGGYVLLDTTDKRQIVFITARGVVTAQVPLVGQGLDDATTVTAISRESTGVWIQLHHATWLLVATPSGQPVLPRVKRLGKATPTSGQMTQVALTPPSGAQVRLTDRTGKGSVINIPASGVQRITGIEQDGSGNTLVGLWSPTSHKLAVVSPKGSVLREDTLPALGPTQDTIEPIRMGRDGSLYVMTVGTDGLTVTRVQP
jgi:hypothetical protein